MEYLFLILPLGLIAVSGYYRTRITRYRNSGRAPDIINAKTHTTLLFVLGLMFILIFFLIKGMQ